MPQQLPADRGFLPWIIADWRDPPGYHLLTYGIRMKDTGIYIFGEVLFDHFPDGKRVLGGAPFNVAWHLQAFGLAPHFISRVGADAEGEAVLAAMRDWGMDTQGVQIDSVSRQVRVTDTVIPLTPHEYQLLEFLASRRGRVYSHDQLIERLYDANSYVTRNAVEAHVSSLRKRLEAAGAPKLVKTRRGFGYLIE